MSPEASGLRLTEKCSSPAGLRFFGLRKPCYCCNFITNSNQGLKPKILKVAAFSQNIRTFNTLICILINCLILLNEQAAPTVLNGLINSFCYKQVIPTG